VEVVEVVASGEDAATVRLAVAAGATPLVADVRRSVAGERPLSCGAEPEPVAAYELVRLMDAAEDRAA
jgi:hypothetical protein